MDRNEGGRSLTGIAVQLDAAEESDSKEKAFHHMTRAKELARNSLEEARRTISALRPPALEKASLADALRLIARQISSGTAVQIHVHTENAATPLPQETEINIFRIAEEAMTNAVRHSKAAAVHLNVRFYPDHGELTIHDNGIGFDPHIPKTNHFGLVGIRERAARLNGDLKIRSQPNQGTRIELIFPL